MKNVIRYIKPVSKVSAEGMVKTVYAKIKEDFESKQRINCQIFVVLAKKKK